ncbi:MAG: cytochrome P450 [Sphingomonadaceae bacterium]
MENLTQDYSFDPTSAEALSDPGASYGELARRCPFYALKTDKHQFWITSDYDEIKRNILADNPDWSFKWGNAAKDTAHDTGIVTDPPFHMAFRNILLPGLTPSAMKVLRPKIEAIATELCDVMAGKSGGDFHHDLALPMPARVMCLMLGLPQEEYRKYKAWADELQELMFHDTQPGSHKTIFAEIYDHCMIMVEERRTMLRDAGIEDADTSHLGDVVPDDYMSRAVVSRVDGRRLTDMEIVNICATFLTGGQETTTNLLSNMLWRLLQNRDLWEQLLADPSLVKIAVEESLRFDPPVLAHFRTSLHPVEMHGHSLPDHAKLMFSIAGANRDPERFPDPDSFRLDRKRSEVSKHLSFGDGIHFCMGAPVARLEAQIALTMLLERFPAMRLDGDGDRIDTWMYWGRKSLPVRWD